MLYLNVFHLWCFAQLLTADVIDCWSIIYWLWRILSPSVLPTPLIPFRRFQPQQQSADSVTTTPSLKPMMATRRHWRSPILCHRRHDDSGQASSSLRWAAPGRSQAYCLNARLAGAARTLLARAPRHWPPSARGPWSYISRRRGSAAVVVRQRTMLFRCRRRWETVGARSSPADRRLRHHRRLS